MKDNFKFILSERVLEVTRDESDSEFIYTANKKSDGIYSVTWFDEGDIEDCEAFYTVKEVEESLEDNDWIIVEEDGVQG